MIFWLKMDGHDCFIAVTKSFGQKQFLNKKHLTHSSHTNAPPKYFLPVPGKPFVSNLTYLPFALRSIFSWLTMDKKIVSYWSILIP